MKTKCFVGIDGGGTKSTFYASDDKGNLIYKCEGGSTNLASNSYEIVRDNISRLFYKLTTFNKNLEITSVCIGTAGISFDNASMTITSIIKELTNCNHITVVSDIDLLLNYYKNENRIILVAGTGSICLGCNSKNEKYQTGGYGHIFSDEGSGYNIGCKILKAVMEEYDGRGNKTILTNFVLQQENLNSPKELVTKVYSKPFDKTYIASFAKLIEKATELNDQVAISICSEVIESLYNLIENNIKKLNTKENITIIFSGSLLTKNKFLYNKLREKLMKNFNNITISNKKIEPYLMACEMGKDNYERYRSNYKR